MAFTMISSSSSTLQDKRCERQRFITHRQAVRSYAQPELSGSEKFGESRGYGLNGGSGSLEAAGPPRGRGHWVVRTIPSASLLIGRGTSPERRSDYLVKSLLMSPRIFIRSG